MVPKVGGAAAQGAAGRKGAVEGDRILVDNNVIILNWFSKLGFTLEIHLFNLLVFNLKHTCMHKESIWKPKGCSLEQFGNHCYRGTRLREGGSTQAT